MSFSSDYQGHRKPKTARTRSTPKRAKAQKREEQVNVKAQALVSELIESGVMGSKTPSDFQVSISGHMNNGPEADDAGQQNFVYISVSRITPSSSKG